MTCNFPVNIHIGVPKSATSSLVENFYSKHKEILNIGRPWDKGPPRALFHDSISNNKTKYGSELQKFLIGEDVSNKQIVLCDDAIISTYAFHRNVPISLKKNLPDSKILLTIRSQKTAIESNYLAQHIQSTIGFNHWVKEHYDYLVATYDYCAQVEDFSLVFGKANVGVFLFEDLILNKTAFSREVCEFIDVSTAIGKNLIDGPIQNRRMSSRELTYLKIRGRFFRDVTPLKFLPTWVRQKLRNLVQSGAPAEIQWDPDLLQKFEQRFRNGNLVLADLLKRDLVKLGYTT